MWYQTTQNSRTFLFQKIKTTHKPHKSKTPNNWFQSTLQAQNQQIKKKKKEEEEEEEKAHQKETKFNTKKSKKKKK